MDQELKQRLIGAAVITALATIFVPMLFDDPIDETGKNINQLKLPEPPSKAQEVEIMPLPEKVEDVATEAPMERPVMSQGKPAAPMANPPMEGLPDEADFEAPKPKVRLSGKETALSPKQAQVIEPDMEASEAEAMAPRPAPSKPTKPVTTVTAPAPMTVPAAGGKKPAAVVTPKAPEIKTVEAKTPPVTTEDVSTKPAPATATPPTETAATRWYLNAGSFTQKSNAVTLQDSLQQQGFASSIKEVTTDKGVVYKVRVGPMLDKAKVQAVKSKLAQININSFVSGDE